MAMLTRWNPLRQATRLGPMADFDDLFRGFGMRPWREMESAPEICIDVSENDKSYIVQAELPGVKKEDIEVSVDGGQVSISAELKRETRKKEGEAELFSERFYGKTFRSFTLPSEVESAKADAHYENGVLTLTLPKAHNGRAQKISVS
jgi:HSP20 family protein